MVRSVVQEKAVYKVLRPVSIYIATKQRESKGIQKKPEQTQTDKISKNTTHDGC